MGFDFEGVFMEIEDRKSISFRLAHERGVSVSIVESGEGSVTVEETLEAEDEHSGEQQRLGWQAILDNVKVHVEASGT